MIMSQSADVQTIGFLAWSASTIIFSSRRRRTNCVVPAGHDPQVVRRRRIAPKCTVMPPFRFFFAVTSLTEMLSSARRREGCRPNVSL